MPPRPPRQAAPQRRRRLPQPPRQPATPNPHPVTLTAAPLQSVWSPVLYTNTLAVVPTALIGIVSRDIEPDSALPEGVDQAVLAGYGAADALSTATRNTPHDKARVRILNSTSLAPPPPRVATASRPHPALPPPASRPRSLATHHRSIQYQGPRPYPRFHLPRPSPLPRSSALSPASPTPSRSPRPPLPRGWKGGTWAADGQPCAPMRPFLDHSLRTCLPGCSLALISD